MSWFKFLMVAGVLASAVSPLALAQIMKPHSPPLPWHLTVSYCYIGHCTTAEREPKYYLGIAFETGEECVAKIEVVTEGQSRLMAMHRTFACARAFEYPGPDDPATNGLGSMNRDLMA